MTSQRERPPVEHLDRLERPVTDERMIVGAQDGLVGCDEPATDPEHHRPSHPGAGRRHRVGHRRFVGHMRILIRPSVPVNDPRATGCLAGGMSILYFARVMTGEQGAA